MTREEFQRAIASLPPELQVAPALGTALVVGFFTWSAWRVRRRTGPEAWSAKSSWSGIFGIWPVMTMNERVLYVLAGLGLLGWGYFDHSLLQGMAPDSG